MQGWRGRLIHSQHWSKGVSTAIQAGQTSEFMVGVYRVFSHYITAAMLVSQNKEMAAMLVSQTKLLGIELYFYVNTFFCFSKPTWPVVT